MGKERGEEGTQRSSHFVCRPSDVMHMKPGIPKNLAALVALLLLLLEAQSETCPPARNHIRPSCASSSSSSHFCHLDNNHQDNLVNCHGVRLRGGGQEREGIGWDPGPAPSSSWNLMHPQWHMQDGVVDQACPEIQAQFPSQGQALGHGSWQDAQQQQQGEGVGKEGGGKGNGGGEAGKQLAMREAADQVMGQGQLVLHHPSNAPVAQDSSGNGRHQISTLLLNTTMLGREYQNAALNPPWPARYICAPLAWLEQAWEPPLSTALLPFEMAKEKVREMRVRSLKRWLTMCCDGSVRADLPWDPETAYSDSWVSWSDWFGVRRRQRAAAVICQICSSKRATRGVPLLAGEMTGKGKWHKRVCVGCASGFPSTIPLSGRCSECHRPATYGHPPSLSSEGGVLVHCKIHKKEGDVILSSRTCRHEGCDRAPTFVSPNSTGVSVCAKHRPKGYADFASRRCGFEGCTRYPSFGSLPGRIAEYCGVHKGPTHVNVYARMCKYPEGCPLRASFGMSNTTTPLFCFKHKLPAHVNMNGVHCTHDGCGKIASYGDSVSGQMRSCKEHRGKKDVLIRRNLCEYVDGCPRRAAFGNSTAKSCSQHKHSTHVALTSQLCVSPGCGKHAAYGDSLDRRAIFCVTHKLKKHVNLKNPTCQTPGCSLAAHFGDQKDGVPVSCAKHRDEQFVDVKNKLCNAAGCDRHAYFADGAEREGDKQSARKKAVRCARHKLATDVDIRNKKCKGMPGCGKQPIFGSPGGGAMHCASHRLEGEVDVRNPQCTVPDCTRRATKRRPGNEALGKVCAKHCESMMRLLSTSMLD